MAAVICLHVEVIGWGSVLHDAVVTCTLVHDYTLFLLFTVASSNSSSSSCCCF